MSLSRNGFRNLLPLMTLLIGIAILGGPTQAHAAFEVRYSTDGGNTWNELGSPVFTNPGAISGTVDGLSITASSNDFRSFSFSTMDIQVSGTLATQSYNLVIQASVFEVPTSPPPQNLNWSFTSSSELTLQGASLAETAQGWVSTDSTLFANDAIPAGGNTGTLSAPSTGSTSFTAPVPPGYSWTEQYTLVGSGVLGDQLSADNNEYITASPAPAGLVLALTGMPVLGIGAWFRRRRVQTAA